MDIGVVRNDTTARVNKGAHVNALQDIDVFALDRITGDSFVANIGQPTKLGLNLIHSMYSLRGDLESPIILPLVGLPLVPASLLNTTSTDSIQSDLDMHH